jgi:hypothetical protein
MKIVNIRPMECLHCGHETSKVHFDDASSITVPTDTARLFGVGDVVRLQDGNKMIYVGRDE